MIAIIDGGRESLTGLQRGLRESGKEVLITPNPKVILKAERVVLPCIHPSLKEAMKILKKARLIDPIVRSIELKKPFLAICSGFQLLFDEGLGIFPGRVVPFRLPKKFKIPHTGWNQIRKRQRIRLLADIPEGSTLYFCHSSHVIPKEGELIATTTDYGLEFCSSVSKNGLFGCQFHPEKSHQPGGLLLKTFASL